MNLSRDRVLSEFARLIMGGIFIIWGSNGFWSFLPLPPASIEGNNFILALKDTGYLFWMEKAIECICGTLLVVNIFVPLCLIILTPILINIILYGVFLDPNVVTLLMPTILLTCMIYLVWSYRGIFKWFFQYQMFSDPVRDERAHLIVMEELLEKHPELFGEFHLPNNEDAKNKAGYYNDKSEKTNLHVENQ